MRHQSHRTSFPTWNRRTFLTAAFAGGAVLPALARQQPAQGTQIPAQQPRDWSGQDPVRYPDPDIVALDNRFRRYIIGNTSIKRLYTGTLWAEGPAWSGAGTIWFTDPPYGIRGNYEGFKGESETKPAIYRVDPKSGQIDLVTDELAGPNGLCFSPDYKRLYVADTGAGREIRVWDVDGKTARNGKRHVQLTIPGSANTPSVADGIRCDVDGNIWAGARPGVLIVAPNGEPIGMIRLPENCANVCFGGSRRNRLFMTASQSLYTVYVEAQGAGVA